MKKIVKTTEVVKGTYQSGKNFGFLIPDDREEYGGDFFCATRNSRGAKDGAKVTGHVLSKSKGKKPEVKIVSIKGIDDIPTGPKFVTGVYSEHGGNFGFVDIEGREKGYFVFKKDNANAKDGDKVEARIKTYKGKKEAVITKILANTEPLILGKFKDQGNFGFVRPLKKIDGEDIFVAGSKKLEANDGDTVSVQIIKQGGRRREGVVKEITYKNPNVKKKVIEDDDEDDF